MKADMDTCEVCGAAKEHLMDLPDGSVYCGIHRGKATIEQGQTGNGAPTGNEASEEANSAGELPAQPIDPESEAMLAELATDPAADLGAVPATPEVPEAHLTKAQRKRHRAKAAAVPRTEDGEPNIDALKLIIGLTLQAALMSLGPNNEALEPPTGWMPPPCNQVPEAEAGAALASAVLISTFGIDHDDVKQLMKPFLDTTKGEEATP